jgi:hypothetical protein
VVFSVVSVPTARAQTADETVLFMLFGIGPGEAAGNVAARKLNDCRYELQNLSTGRKWELHFDKMSDYKASLVAGLALIAIRGEGVLAFDGKTDNIWVTPVKDGVTLDVSFQ